MKVLEIKSDERGNYLEVFKIPGCGQASYAISKPGAVRGNHYHKRKEETICVIEGEAEIRMRNRENNEIKEYRVSGNKPQSFEMSVNWTHSIKNIGKEELKLLIWANEIFDPSNPDTYAETV